MFIGTYICGWLGTYVFGEGNVVAKSNEMDFLF